MTSTSTPSARAVAELNQHDPVALALGIEVVHAENGRVTLAMSPNPAMLNGYGLIHGGYIFLLGDTALAYACRSEGDQAATRAAEIAFLASGRPANRIVAEAARRARHGRSGIYDVTITNADGDVLAEMRGHTVVPSTPTPLLAGKGGADDA